jgi:hypothetical protein
MDAQWPAGRSYDTYHRVHDVLLADSDAEFRGLLNRKPTRSGGPVNPAVRPDHDRLVR